MSIDASKTNPFVYVLTCPINGYLYSRNKNEIWTPLFEDARQYTELYDAITRWVYLQVVTGGCDIKIL